jgi:hypothetical protein
MAIITADMLTENPKPKDLFGMGIAPGDTVRVSREFEVTEVAYNELTDNYTIGTYGGYKYGSNNWKMEKTSDNKYLHKLIFGDNYKEDQVMGLYNGLQQAKPAATVVGDEKLTEVTRYQDLKPGDVIRITRDAVVSNVSTWDGITTKDGRKVRIAAAESAELKKSGFKVVKVQPNEPDFWPPKAGDVWEVSGHLYFAQVSTYGSTQVLLRAADGYSYSNLSVTQAKEKNPVLKYRKGVTLS